MEGIIGASEWLAIANVICNTVQVVALAYIGTIVGQSRGRAIADDHHDARRH